MNYFYAIIHHNTALRNKWREKFIRVPVTCPKMLVMYPQPHSYGYSILAPILVSVCDNFCGGLCMISINFWFSIWMAKKALVEKFAVSYLLWRKGGSRLNFPFSIVLYESCYGNGTYLSHLSLSRASVYSNLMALFRHNMKHPQALNPQSMISARRSVF